MDELYIINVNSDRVRTEQCEQTKCFEENTNMWDNIATKIMIIKMLSENLNKITNFFYNSNDSDLLTKRQQNSSFIYPKGNNSKNSKPTSDNAFNRPLTKINSDTITSPNRFSPLQNYELSKSKNDNDENISTNFECNSSTNSTIKPKSPNKRLSDKRPVLINQFPENQTDFTRLRTVPGEKPYSSTVKTRYNGNIKVFSDSIPRGIRVRDFNKFVREGKNQISMFSRCYFCKVVANIWMLA